MSRVIFYKKIVYCLNLLGIERIGRGTDGDVAALVCLDGTGAEVG